jgi:GntR family transcriptional regulator
MTLGEGEPEVVLDGAGPIHRRIYEQIRDLIANGTLKPGEQLPTVRAAAVELGVNPNAVAQAYAELADAGLVSDADGSGTYVAGSQENNSSPTALAALAADFLARAAELGFTAEDALRAVQALHERRNAP